MRSFAGFFVVDLYNLLVTVELQVIWRSCSVNVMLAVDPTGLFEFSHMINRFIILVQIYVNLLGHLHQNFNKIDIGTISITRS